MRLYPSAPMIFRETKEEFEIGNVKCLILMQRVYLRHGSPQALIKFPKDAIFRFQFTLCTEMLEFSPNPLFSIRIASCLNFHPGAILTRTFRSVPDQEIASVSHTHFEKKMGINKKKV